MEEAWGCGASRVLIRPLLSSNPCPQLMSPCTAPLAVAGPWQRAWDHASWGVYPAVARHSWLRQTLPSPIPTPFHARDLKRVMFPAADRTCLLGSGPRGRASLPPFFLEFLSPSSPHPRPVPLSSLGTLRGGPLPPSGVSYSLPDSEMEAASGRLSPRGERPWPERVSALH